MNAAAPLVDPAVPDAVARLAGTDELRAVWVNELGGTTWQLTSADADGRHRFVKWAPSISGLRLEAELARLDWAFGYVAVPAVIAFGGDEDGDWLLTEGLGGDNAASARWQADPLVAATAVGAGLRHLHDALPVGTCPFTWSIAERIAAHQRQGDAVSVTEQDAPPVVDPVVCHGDACLPNTVLRPDGGLAGHVDLGRLGVADRWADLAVATWSTEWTFGPGFEHAVLAGYGIDADFERIDFYRRLWGSAPGS
ncbi:aminoglycoside 3'-phosphotransferase [Jatrophihabitans telluris]|uniref:Aminoglycoside 3'-phosphotransferase n=1 Tax=Jatrophihabitans telluris TaxID=2038343 RepID=A0ABY4R0X8_9ACTN|nr:aminoglycoside 3'-phosphotransferase [Jatrophihabitans telluris]UQX89568.1 aminoglycoside 3'-phosphotransferase [Jatrophihabitans telluris]